MLVPPTGAALRQAQALTGLRLLLALLIAIHGWYRFASAGYVPFGGFLEASGLPFGLALAMAVTAFEILGTPLLAWGRAVVPLCLGYASVYAVGIALVHWPAGWFVVGAGRNGMEYSVLLIGGLLATAWAHRPGR